MSVTSRPTKSSLPAIYPFLSLFFPVHHFNQALPTTGLINPAGQNPTVARRL